MQKNTQEKITDLERLVGTWRLISSTQHLHDGQILQVFDDNPLGYFIFTQEGVMSVQIMRNLRDGTNNNLLKDYLAYSGRFTVDSKEKIIHLNVETSLSVNYLGKELKRRYEFINQQLKLKPLETNVEHVIVWERVSTVC